jgi:hypothetical protein
MSLSTLKVSAASFSSSFSPGAVDVTLSVSKRERATFLIWSMTRTVARNKAYTRGKHG